MLTVFRGEYVKPESSQRPSIYGTGWCSAQKNEIADFRKELNRRARKAFGGNDQAMVGSLLYDKLLLILKCSFNMKRLENAT